MASRARRAARRIRRSPKTFKLLNAAESYAQLNIATTQFLGTNAAEFFLGDLGVKGIGQTGQGEYSLAELIRNPQLLGTVGRRFADPERVVSVVVQSALTNVGFRVVKRLLRKNIAMVNRPMRQLGLGVTL